MRWLGTEKARCHGGIRKGARQVRRVRAWVAVGAALAAALPLSAQWTQTWGGNFPGAANSTYNHSNWWNNVQSSPVWGDGTQQITSDSTNNVYVDGNGNLVIAMTYSPGATYPYTSARLTSRRGVSTRMTAISSPILEGLTA